MCGKIGDADMNFDDNLTKLVTRGLVAAYILYLAIKIITSGASAHNGALLICIGIIFLITSVVFMTSVSSSWADPLKRTSPEEPLPGGSFFICTLIYVSINYRFSV